MAILKQFSILVLLNIIIRIQCIDNESDYSKTYQEDNPLKQRTQQHNTDVEYDTSQETTDRVVETTYTTDNINTRDNIEDGAKTTALYVTEASTVYLNDIYDRKSAEDVYENNRQSEYATTQDTGEDNEELVYRADDEEQRDSIGQRNPKTEADSSEQTEKRTFEKPRPTVTLSRSSTLKSWLEDSWLRPPAGILVPLRPVALTRALGVWNDLTEEGLNVTDIVIVGYDSNGVNWRSRHNLQPSASGSSERAVSEALSKLLLKYQDVYTDSMGDGTMRALASAAKLVPYDSALFIITDKGAADSQRLPLALRALIEKRLKVYTIWTDPSYPALDSELALQDLRNVSVHTDGEVLPYSIQIMDEDSSDNLASEAELQQWMPLELPQPRHARLQSHPDLERFDTLLIRRGAGEAISLGIPIETGVTALRVYIEGEVEYAVLYPPNNEPQIDLNNSTSVRTFSPSSTTVSLSPREVHLVFPGHSNEDALSVLPVTPSDVDSSRMVGVWHLSLRCDACDYRIRISARSRIHFDVDMQGKDTLKLHLAGPLANVRESILVDEMGAELSRLPFSYQPTDGMHDADGEMADLQVDLPLPTVPHTKVYVKILGRDIKGEPFVRVAGPVHPQSEVRLGRSAAIAFPNDDLERAEEFDSWIYQRLQHNDSNILPFGRATSQVLNQGGTILTSVQIGLSSRLYGAPGERLQLHFEVTNFREQSVLFRFGAVGELRFLTGIEPASQMVTSGQTVNVIVSLLISTAAQPGARDLITFTAYGLEQVSLSAYVYVLNPGESIRDVWAPEVRHNFAGSCWGKLGNDCAEHTWSSTIIARDSVGGLLRLTSSPLGLIYDSNFISGTREEVTATYRSSCCTPRVVVNAVDAFGNTNSYVIDISNYITGAGIAAIVLAVLLAIVLVALLIFGIYWCVKRRKESKELPSSYVTSRNIS